MRTFKIHLIRHGLPEGSELGQYIGHTDVPLSADGKKQLKDMKLKPNTLVSFINRSGKIIIPTGNDSIEVGDTVMVVTKNKGFTALTDILR